MEQPGMMQAMVNALRDKVGLDTAISGRLDALARRVDGLGVGAEAFQPHLALDPERSGDGTDADAIRLGHAVTF